MPSITIKIISVGIHTQYWWTDRWRDCTVRSFMFRLFSAPFYMLYAGYLCLKGIPIEVNLNYNINLPEAQRKEKTRAELLDTR